MPGPTPYSEVNKLLLHFLVRLQRALGKKLAGLYLYGSLSLGDFDPESSDVDFLVATTEELSEKELVLLKEMHAAVAASGLRYAGRLEGSYIPLAALRRYDPNNASHPTIGSDWDFRVAHHGSNWILERYIVREYGVTVWGPPPDSLIDPIQPGDLRKAVCAQLAGFWQQQVAGPGEPEWLRPRYEQAFAVLTMCRALYTLEEGMVSSKPAAAAWALQALEPEWHHLIKRALAWRSQHEKDDLTETLSFVRYAIERGMEKCQV